MAKAAPANRGLACDTSLSQCVRHEMRKEWSS